MRIDCHNHPDWHGINLERFLENLDLCGIDKSCLMSWECPRHEIAPGSYWAFSGQDDRGPVMFERCISYAERAPGRFILGHCPDPRIPGAVQKMRSAAEIYDVKVCGELKLRMMYDNPDALGLFRFCGERGIPVLVHIDYPIGDSGWPHPNYWYGGGIEPFERAMAACPETNFIGHAPGFWAHISGDDRHLHEHYPKGPVLPGGKLIRMLEKYRNLYCDMSAGSGCNALTRDPEFGKRFLTDYADRILYGRDYFDNVHQEFIESCNLSEDVKNKIYSENFLKLIGEL